MSSKTPNLKVTSKTGRAQRMREWMKGRKKPWTSMEICEGVGAVLVQERSRVRIDIVDFIARGEISLAGRTVKRNRRQNLYTYNPAYRLNSRAGALKKRIYKAMYVSVEAFALSDIQRLANAPGRSYLDKMIGPLKAAGQVQVVGRRHCAHGAGAEKLYQIVNRDRFRLEVMG
jgi:hypothetical protein